MENNSNNNSSNQNRSWEDNNNNNQGFDSTASQQQQQYQHQGNQNWSSQPYRSKLPADPAAMVLAIIATVLLVICCCVGGQYIAIILSVIGFILATSSVNKYKQNAGQYDPGSFKKVNNARIFNLVVGIVSILLVILSFIGIFASAFDDYNYLDMMDQDDEWSTEEGVYEESEVEDEWYEYEEEVDSLKQEIDSLEIEEVIEVIEVEESPED